MDNYKPNSHKYKAEQREKQTGERKKLEKVVSGEAKIKKKSEIRKFTDVFIAEDASNVKSYIFSDVLVPALKKLVSDIVTDGIDMILFGGSRRVSGSGINATKISYRNFYDRDRRDDHRPAYRDSVTRNGYSYDDITVSSKGEAEAVFARMGELLDQYDMVSVADLYELVGISGSYTDHNYGWYSISDAEAVRTMDGRYWLKLPKA